MHNDRVPRPPSIVSNVGPSITFEAEGCVMGYWHDIAIVVWATQATVPLIEEFARLAEQVTQRHPRVSTVQLLATGSTIPTPDARAALNDLIARYADRAVGCAAIMEGSGFWASMMRSFLTGLQLFQRDGWKTKFCATSREAAQWLADLHAHQFDEILDAEQLTAAIDQLNARAHPGQQASGSAH
jgi:hypothetical protein